MTDAGLNCISNIRPQKGLGYQAAATTLLYLIKEARQRKPRLALKDLKPGASGIKSTTAR